MHTIRPLLWRSYSHKKETVSRTHEKISRYPVLLIWVNFFGRLLGQASCIFGDSYFIFFSITSFLLLIHWMEKSLLHVYSKCRWMIFYINFDHILVLFVPPDKNEVIVFSMCFSRVQLTYAQFLKSCYFFLQFKPVFLWFHSIFNFAFEFCKLVATYVWLQKAWGCSFEIRQWRQKMCEIRE